MGDRTGRRLKRGLFSEAVYFEGSPHISKPSVLLGDTALQFLCSHIVCTFQACSGFGVEYAFLCFVKQLSLRDVAVLSFLFPSLKFSVHYDCNSSSEPNLSCFKRILYLSTSSWSCPPQEGSALTAAYAV